MFWLYLLFVHLLGLLPLNEVISPASGDDFSLIVLGIAQDAGYPQINCGLSCCRMAWVQPKKRHYTSCIAILNHRKKQYYLIDATPDIKDQIYYLKQRYAYDLSGIFLTHAHMGHYTGLMHLGREALGAKEIPVYAMPKMANFLKSNGPWSQLVNLGNIQIKPLFHNQDLQLHPQLTLRPYLVPHRDEFSETVGYQIKGPKHSGWFIPDIDKWHLWDLRIENELAEDFLLIDGTFYKDDEIKGRAMSEIPHPFIEETMTLLDAFPKEDKKKVHFIHLNHTNPALWDLEVQSNIESKGFNIATQGQVLTL